MINKDDAYYMTGERVWKSQCVDKAIEDAIAKHKFNVTVEVHKTTASTIRGFGHKCLGFRMSKSTAKSDDRVAINIHWND
jgi:hypothetical protein